MSNPISVWSTFEHPSIELAPEQDSDLDNYTETPQVIEDEDWSN